MPSGVGTGSGSGDSVSRDGNRLRAFIERHARLLVLTGAGCSTESGIPDYRDADGGWKRAAPVMFQAFIGDAAMRQRYWARSLVGWRRLRTAQPNAAHRALVQLQRQQRLQCLVTQNVDRLHQLAGSDDVIDRLTAGQDPRSIQETYRDQLAAFVKLREQYLLYR